MHKPTLRPTHRYLRRYSMWYRKVPLTRTSGVGVDSEDDSAESCTLCPYKYANTPPLVQPHQIPPLRKVTVLGNMVQYQICNYTYGSWASAAVKEGGEVD